MKTQNPDTFINKFYFLVILVFLSIFLVSNLNDNKNVITESQKKELNTNQNITVFQEDNKDL